MRVARRGVSPVISVTLMVAIVIVLAAVLSMTVLDFSEDLDDPAPNVADTTGEFEVGSADADNQVVRITHVAGDSVAIEEVEIIVRASGPGADMPTGVRLVDLPGDHGSFDRALADENIQGLDAQSDSDFIEQRGRFNFGINYSGDQVIVVDDSNTWSAGDTIQFSVSADKGGADFREPVDEPDREADELEVIIVHTESNAILSEYTFTP